MGSYQLSIDLKPVVLGVHSSTVQLVVPLFRHRVMHCTSYYKHSFNVLRGTAAVIFTFCTYKQSFLFETQCSLPKPSYVTGTGAQSARLCCVCNMFVFHFSSRGPLYPVNATLDMVPGTPPKNAEFARQSVLPVQHRLFWWS